MNAAFIRFCSICALLWVIPFVPASAQGLQHPATPRHPAAPREIFERVQEGLSDGNVGAFSKFLASSVSVSLRGSEGGYYSGSQARYLLENYFRFHHLGRFTFTTVDDSGSNPYATGSVAFNSHGARELAQIYVSLTSEHDGWLITQINIY